MGSEFNPPVQIAAWLACLAFVLMLINGGFKLARNVKGDPAHPANPQLGQAVTELGRRIAELEEWREQLVEKMDLDKFEILKAGEDRASKIHEHIEQDRRDMDSKVLNMPDRIVALLRNLGAIK